VHAYKHTVGIGKILIYLMSSQSRGPKNICWIGLSFPFAEFHTWESFPWDLYCALGLVKGITPLHLPFLPSFKSLVLYIEKELQIFPESKA
jgi:hypothetical protein